MNYSKINDESEARIWNLIAESERIFITSHRSPDGDSIASTLGLYAGIKKRHPEKSVRIAYSNEPVPFFSQFENYDKIEFVEECAAEAGDADLLVLLDAGQWSRASKSPESFPSDRRTLCIDHHVSAPDKFTLSLIDTDSPSCAQLVYKLIGPENVDESLAKTFLAGILGDTGYLSFVRPHQGETFQIVQRLLEICQLSIDQFRSRFDGMSKDEFEILQEYIRNTKFEEISGYAPFTWSCITREYAEKRGFSESEITAAKNIYTAMFMKSIKNYDWGLTVSPRKDGSASVSFRSVALGENVRKIAEALGGGGHDAAAGAGLADIRDMDKAFEIVVEKMKELKATS